MLFHEIFFDMYNNQQANGKFKYIRMWVKVNSVQGACAKFLANHMKKQNKKHKNAKSIGENWKLRVCYSFFHVIYKISNNMWTAKHLAQASFTELTLHINATSTWQITIVPDIFPHNLCISVNYSDGNHFKSRGYALGSFKTTRPWISEANGIDPFLSGIA